MAVKVVDASALAALLFGEPEAEDVAGRLQERVHDIVQQTFVDVLGPQRAVMVAEAMASLARPHAG